MRGRPLIDLFLDVRTRFSAGDIRGAQRVQSRINDVIEVLVGIDVFPAAKYLAGLGIAPTGDCRRPFAKLTQADKGRLDDLHVRIQEFIRLSSVGE